MADRTKEAPHPIKPCRQKSYYSDSGTGSYSGLDMPLLETPAGQDLTPQILQSSRVSVLHQSLAKSLSVAIPIPLFTSEQYRVTSSDAVGDSAGTSQKNELHRLPSSASAQEHSSSPFLTVHGGYCEFTTHNSDRTSGV